MRDLGTNLWFEAGFDFNFFTSWSVKFYYNQKFEYCATKRLIYHYSTKAFILAILNVYYLPWTASLWHSYLAWGWSCFLTPRACSSSICTTSRRLSRLNCFFSGSSIATLSRFTPSPSSSLHWFHWGCHSSGTSSCQTWCCAWLVVFASRLPCSVFDIHVSV